MLRNTKSDNKNKSNTNGYSSKELDTIIMEKIKFFKGVPSMYLLLQYCKVWFHPQTLVFMFLFFLGASIDRIPIHYILHRPTLFSLFFL